METADSKKYFFNRTLQKIKNPKLMINNKGTNKLSIDNEGALIGEMYGNRYEKRSTMAATELRTNRIRSSIDVYFFLLTMLGYYAAIFFV